MRRLPFLASARGRLLMFNILVIAVTLMVSIVAIMGFNHAGKLQEQVQAQTLQEMTGSMALSRDTSNVATAAILLSQVVGALEYQSESARLQQTQVALQDSLTRLADAPLARSEPALVKRIISRSNALKNSVTRMLDLGHARHLQRNILLSGLYQTQSTLHHIASLNQRNRLSQPSVPLLNQVDRLLTIAIQTPTPTAAMQQLSNVMTDWPPHSSNALVDEKMQQLRSSERRLLPQTLALEQSNLALAFYTYHIKALVAMLNDDIHIYVQKVADESEQRTHQTHRELSSIIMFIGLFALLAIVITGFSGLYIYHNVGSNLTAIANAMTRLARGERDVSVPALQRRDELGELARAFNVFARNTTSLEQTSRLLKEKSTQLETTAEALVHSQKMKAVGQLTGGLAHDFNNLLAVIIGSLELTRQHTLDSQTEQRITRALKAAERGAQLTQRLLAFSRKQALHPQTVSLKELVENLQELLHHSLPSTLTLAIDTQPNSWLAWIDANQLENALINLVVNARDAMEGRNGIINIRIYNQHVIRSSGKKQDMVALEVVDSGRGMTEEIKTQVFEPFFTTKAVGNGSGLGLSMVYGFVRQSGGRIQVESEPGKGTLVRLQLPRATAPLVNMPSSLPAEPYDNGDQLVLVLEDENDVRQTLCEHLHQLGYLTLDSADSTEALSMLRRTPDITLLISDLMLPGELSGAQVIRQAHAINPRLITLLISGQDIRQQHEGDLPEIALLRKPFSQQQLALALQRARRRNTNHDVNRRPADR